MTSLGAYLKVRGAAANNTPAALPAFNGPEDFALISERVDRPDSAMNLIFPIFLRTFSVAWDPEEGLGQKAMNEKARTSG